MRQQDPNVSPPSRFWLRRTDQGCLGVALAVSLASLALFYLGHRNQRGGVIDVDQTTDPLPLQFQVDINRAAWPELTLLPGIGENLAKRIVESREVDGPFRDHDDLQRVRGIGPRTVQRVRLYLRPIPATEDIAGE